ncbi:hypothetical protein [Clostridium kluyveri]|uniref:hypothetical protein n=1 Tax=Clostridium kluyveri TaxID=1534 RepID=UPI0022454FCD|nr:hypothetical protein [Clostridium kluyveri]UZQ52402.1 hypothetical protein OP486_09670 [Clostridium kluyveri]
MNINQILSMLNPIDVQETDKFKDVHLVHMADALVFNKKMRTDLSRLYDSDKYRFYKKAKESTAYNIDLVTQVALDKEIHIKKSIGLILCAEEDPDLLKKLIDIVKKYYFKVYQAYKNASLEIMAELSIDLLRSCTDNIGFKAYQFILMFLIKYAKERPENFIDQIFLRAIAQDVEFAEKHSVIKMDTPKKIEEKETLIDGILERINCNKGNIKSAEDILYCSNKEIADYGQMMAVLFDFEKMSISNMLNHIELTDHDIKEIILAYTLKYNDKNLERSTNVLLNGILIKSLIKAYKEVKRLYFENNKETLYLEMQLYEDKIKELTEENKNLSEKLKKIENEHRAIEEKLIQSHSTELSNVKKGNGETISALNKEIKQLKKQLEKQSLNNSELFALRETLFNIEKEEDTPYKTDINLSDILKDKKVLVIGGRDELRKKIKDKYEEISVIDGFNESFDTRIINSMDIVFFYVGSMSHAVYYKAISAIRKNNTPFHYIGKTNIDLIECEMAEELAKVCNI